jgi:hypothetical protein
MNNSFRIYTVFFFLLCTNLIHAQDTIQADTLKNYRSPKKAAILSAAIPGAGQIYNHASVKGKRRLWKVPIVYAGLATAGYFLYDNTKNINVLRTEYLWRIDETLNPTGLGFNNPDYQNYTTDNVRTALDQYKDWRDLSVVCIAGIYILQIVDASVDAHLFNHDISPNLSLIITPKIGLNTTRSFGFGLTLLRK